MNNKVLVVGVVVAVLLSVGVVAGLNLPASDVPSVVKGEPGAPGKPGTDGKSPVVKLVGDRLSVNGVLSPSLTGPKGDAGESLGALVGPDLFLPYLAVNGVTQVHVSQGIRQATSTACAILSPTASSTLSNHTVNFNAATTSHLGVDIYKTTGKTVLATTSQTQIGSSYDFAPAGNETNSGVLGISASSTIDGRLGQEAGFFKPAQLLVVKLYADGDDLDAAPDSDKSFNIGGSCKAVFQLY